MARDPVARAGPVSTPPAPAPPVTVRPALVRRAAGGRGKPRIAAASGSGTLVRWGEPRMSTAPDPAARATTGRAMTDRATTDRAMELPDPEPRGAPPTTRQDLGLRSGPVASAPGNPDRPARSPPDPVRATTNRRPTARATTSRRLTAHANGIGGLPVPAAGSTTAALSGRTSRCGPTSPSARP
jgi:hypothetical protein